MAKRRDNQVQIRLSDDEREFLDQTADDLDLNRSTLLRGGAKFIAFLLHSEGISESLEGGAPKSFRELLEMVDSS